MPGIYRLKDDRLTLCCSLPGEPRPKEFASKKGSHVYLVALERVKPEKK